MDEQLTVQELQTLINIVAQVQVPVSQAASLIELINKMSRLVDQLQANKEEQSVSEPK
jgi:hypothetical protein